MLEKILSSGSQKTVVGVSLTPGIGLEAVIYNKEQNVVVNYARRKVEYNFSTREPQDYIEFKTALAELMDELKVLPKTMAYLILPNVYFDFINLPSEMGEAEIKTALLSKAEEFYVFKREEPVSGWAEVINPDGDGTKKYVYSSFQRNVVTQMKDAFSDIGLQLVGIENTYSATIRGLYTIGYLEDVIQEQAPWTAMVINTNSYTLLNMDGKNLIEYTEVPLAIKSFSAEEAYQAVVSSSGQLLSGYASQRLYIISQTEDISARILKKNMDYDHEIVAIDSNRYADPSKLFVNLAGGVEPTEVRFISLSSIGAAAPKCDLKLKLNALADDPDASMGIYFTANILGTEVDVTNDLVMRLSFVSAVAFVILFGAFVAFCNIFASRCSNTIADLRNQIEVLDEQIKTESENEVKPEVDMNIIIDDVAKANVMANSFYDSIATDIPQSVWLTRYYNKSGDKIAVKGIAQSIVDIYEYYKNLRIVAPESAIKLTELQVVTPNPDDSYIRGLDVNENTDRLYSFEISNIDIDFGKENESVHNPPVDENDIIINVNKKKVDQPSEQMQPAQ